MSDIDDPQMCGICLESGETKNNKLVKPCSCNIYRHQDCLRKWITIKKNNLICDICKTQYTHEIIKCKKWLTFTFWREVAIYASCVFYTIFLLLIFPDVWYPIKEVAYTAFSLKIAVYTIIVSCCELIHKNCPPITYTHIFCAPYVLFSALISMAYILTNLTNDDVNRSMMHIAYTNVVFGFAHFQGIKSTQLLCEDMDDTAFVFRSKLIEHIYSAIYCVGINVILFFVNIIGGVYYYVFIGLVMSEIFTSSLGFMSEIHKKIAHMMVITTIGFPIGGIYALATGNYRSNIYCQCFFSAAILLYYVLIIVAYRVSKCIAVLKANEVGVIMPIDREDHREKQTDKLVNNVPLEVV
jgi:hypothetical protein